MDTSFKNYFRAVRQQEALRRLERYPQAEEHIMPTKLGNALRRGEMGAGAPYGFNALPVLPHLHTTSDPDAVAYTEGARTQLDLSVTLCMVFSLLGTTALIVFRDESAPWLWVILALWVMARIMYGGAVAAARDYGSSLRVLVDLGRFDLYRSLRLKMPDSLDEERRFTPGLVEMLSERGYVQPLAYVHPVETPGS